MLTRSENTEYFTRSNNVNTGLAFWTRNNSNSYHLTVIPALFYSTTCFIVHVRENESACLVDGKDVGMEPLKVRVGEVVAEREKKLVMD